MKNTVLCLCIILSLTSLATAQTYEFNVSCPVKDQYVTDQNGCTFAVYPSAMHGNPFTMASPDQDNCECGPALHRVQPRPITAKEMIADQNQYLEKQFAQIYADYEKLMAEMNHHRASTDAAINNLGKTIRKIGPANRLAIESMSKQAKARDQKLMKAVQESADSVTKLSQDLIEVAEKSVENNRSMIEILQSSEEKFAKFQKQVKGSLKSINQKSGESKEISAHLSEQQRHIQELFEALDEDMEEIRKRIETIEREGAKRQRSLMGRLKLLEEIRKTLGETEEKKKPKRKKNK